MSTLLIFGYGYTARFFAQAMQSDFSQIIGTTRQPQAQQHDRVKLLRFAGVETDPALQSAVRDAEAILVSIPPDDQGDPVLHVFSDLLRKNKKLRWLGYLSTVGVYGDHQGGWVNEQTPLAPRSDRSRRRVEAEQAWLDLGQEAGLPVHLFRLAGIYGPGKNALVNLRQGTAKRIIKPNQVFNRIHVADIARVLKASWQNPQPWSLYNVSDDAPSPPQEVIEYAAQKMSVPLPAAIPFETATLSPMALSPMARSFYAENKRVSNALMKQALGVTLSYPSYREGLDALYAAGEGR
jgi:nucleoside-diphosphate-sugar epimerase